LNFKYEIVRLRVTEKAPIVVLGKERPYDFLKIY